MPSVKALHEKYKDKGLVVIGMHTRKDGAKMAAFVESEKLGYACVVDNGTALTEYQIHEYPTSVLIDKKGIIVSIAAGKLPTNAEIEKLLGAEGGDEKKDEPKKDEPKKDEPKKDEPKDSPKKEEPKK